MDPATLYENDFYAWSQHQAGVLRGLRQAGVRLPNTLDLDHVAEEIEDLGSEQRFQVESHWLQAFAHLIKLAALPESDAARHWRSETLVFLANARRRYRPSMRRAIDLEAVWSDACRIACANHEADGVAPPPLPGTCPFDIEGLTDRSASPVEMAQQLVVTP